MLSRRTVITAGALGSLAGLPAPADAGEVQSPDDRNAERITRAIQEVERTLDSAFTRNSLSYGAVGGLRKNFEQFLRANGKFPDYAEVGIGVFFEIYDWHVRHGQQLNITRQPDGRYFLQFMFTLLILRHDTEPNFMGYPYDNR